MHYFSPKVLQALEFASIAHKGQMRKFPPNIPYVSHINAVALILCRSGFREEVVMAGILHDVLEDTKFTQKDIEEKFGEEVLTLVLAVTEDKTLPWQQRKEQYIENLKNHNEEAKAVSAADLYANRLSNLLGLRAGINPWTSFSSDPGTYTKKIFDIDRKRLAAIKENSNIPFMKELEDAAFEVEEITKKIIGEQAVKSSENVPLG